MGKQRKGRDISGVLLLDKPKGISSNQALQQAKRLFNAAKAGHTGSLDPIATGMLPICFGEATKFSSYLLEADKTYEVVAKLGYVSTTGDSEGDISVTMPEEDVAAIDDKLLFDTIRTFLGESTQIPPMYSALKHQGQPLYKLARKGIEIERAARHIVINNIQAERVSFNEFKLIVSCSKGTYIRVLVEDIGKKMGCGAYLTALRRTSVADFSHHPMHTIEALQQLESERLDSCLLPVDTMLLHLTGLELSKEEVFYLFRGQSITPSSIYPQGKVRLYNAALEFLGIGEIVEDGRLLPCRLVALR